MFHNCPSVPLPRPSKAHEEGARGRGQRKGCGIYGRRPSTASFLFCCCRSELFFLSLRPPFLVERKPLSDNLQGFSPLPPVSPPPKERDAIMGRLRSQRKGKGTRKYCSYGEKRLSPIFILRRTYFSATISSQCCLRCWLASFLIFFFLFWQTSPCLTANASRHGKRERGGVISFLPSFSSTSGAAVFGIDRVKTLRFPRKESI